MGHPYTDEVQQVMDRRIDNPEAIKGELVRAPRIPPYMLLIFNDGSWAAFEAGEDYDEAAIYFTHGAVDPFVLCEAGLITSDELEEWVAYDHKHRAEAVRERELKELKRLKKKYE